MKLIFENNAERSLVDHTDTVLEDCSEINLDGRTTVGNPTAVS